MGKVILEFDSVEEQDEIKSALEGYKWKLAVWDIDQKLRETTKYDKSILSESYNCTEEEMAIAEKYREEIREILTGYGLNLE